ncbi:Hypothetical predicted protein [Mytilus galloprovincialis]|uniref:Uncharacterized protein n=1 Tax=Mytilus galloprovincialis TaxID=29158 RepID=A0A8B6CZN6_MYTGA|nr:Hypothetical predicted protein [Mytilus galloprovincialis]
MEQPRNEEEDSIPEVGSSSEDEGSFDLDEDLEAVTSHEQNLASPFNEPNIALVFGQKDTVHHMLPLAEEYQTDDFKKRIEKFLINSVQSQSDSITSEQIIVKILEAERYKLNGYLNACIGVASKKQVHCLTESHRFEEISQNTQLKIGLKRMEDIDKIYNNAISSGYTSRQNQFYMKDLGTHLKPYMQDN